MDFTIKVLSHLSNGFSLIIFLLIVKSIQDRKIIPGSDYNGIQEPDILDIINK